VKTTNKISGNRVANLVDRISLLSGTIAGIGMLMVALINTYEVIMRRLFDKPGPWVFTVSLFTLMWFVFLGAPLGTSENRQITADFLVSHLSDRTGTMLRVMTNFISLVFIAILGFYGFEMCAEAHAKKMMSFDLLMYPMWILYLIFPIGMFLLFSQVVRILVRDILQVKKMELDASQGWHDNPRVILPSFAVLVGIGLWLVHASPVAGIIFLALCLILGGLPVSFALGCTGSFALFIIYRGFGSLSLVPIITERTLSNFVLLAVPLFIMAGVILYKSGMGERIYDLASKLMGTLPGGLAVATVVACALLSATVGSSTAVAASIGIMAVPMLLAKGYTKEMTYGSIAGGALGALIPPSAGLIVYGFMANASVGALFAAAFIPGFIVVALFSIYVVINCGVSKKYDRVSASWGERVTAFKRGILGLLAPVFVLGGIYSGVFTPTEAAGVLVTYSLIVAFVYKKMNWRTFIEIVREGTILGSMIMMVMVGAMIFAHVIAHLRVARLIAEWLATANVSYWLIISGIFLLYIILGMFLEGLSITVLTVPVLYPLMPTLGLDVVVFGVILMMFVEIALITPPVGLNLFMVKAISGDNLWPIMKGNLPFVFLLLLGAIICFLFPELSLWLPKRLGIY
jgi:tripartite ATP-independent transporter DctM subunit